MIPYDEEKSIEFSRIIDRSYQEAHRPYDGGGCIFASRAAYDYYTGLLSWPASRDKHEQELRQALGLPANGGGSNPPDPGPVGTPRPGIVRCSNRVFSDDLGPFRPLGATLFWALDGWRHDRDRVRQTFAWLSARRVDFVRILADVGWPGQEIDSSAPDFEQILGECVDDAYATGLRTEITVWGGSSRDPIAAAGRVANVVMNGRMHKILDLEPANEPYQNGPSDDLIVRMLAILNGTGCLTAAEPTWDHGTGLSEPLQYWIERGAKIGAVHLDRDLGAHGERAVRQPWDLSGFAYGVNHNEPVGPRSSVAQLDDPGKLAMLRAMGIFSGVAAFVLHNANGVTGKPDPAHDRGGNLWDVPNIDTIHRCVKNVEAWLPVGIETWGKTTQHGADPIGPHPLTADAIWSDGHDHGCDRCYGAIAPDGATFITMVSDVVNYVQLTARQHCRLQGVNVLTGQWFDGVELSPGMALRLEEDHRDVIVQGQFL